MIAPRCERDREHLSRLLVGDMTEAAMADTTQHLDTCDECRNYLEQLAAGANWWREARQFLSDDDLPPCEMEARHSIDATCDVALSAQDLIKSFLQETDDASLVGTLDQYDILSVIGCGGMGVVLKGRERQLNRHVAIKVLAPHYATNAAARKRFAREAQAAAAVVHPHVLAIHSVSIQGRLPYLVTPYVAGQSLQQRLDREGPLELLDVLRIAMQAAQGLAAAHAQGLVHRDVKPANILLENDVQRVLLTDFGLARAVDDVSLTCSGTIAGTPQYMSPEQARGESLDHRTDLFSLGSVMYAMCAGRPPFRADTTLGVLRRICDDPPRDLRDINPDVPVWLVALIEKLLAKAPDARFQTAQEVARLLERCLAHLQHPTAVPLPHAVKVLVAKRRRERSAARWASWAGLAAMFVTAVVVAVLWVHPMSEDLPRNAPSSPAHVMPTLDREPAAPRPSEAIARWNDGMEEKLAEIRADLQSLAQEEVLSW